MRDEFEVPKQAIYAFETALRLRVTIHDRAGTLWPFLPPERFVHNHQPLCGAIKAHHLERCMQFDLKRTHDEILDHPEGRAQICHAGLVQWVVPAFNEAGLEWVFFAGQRRPADDLQHAAHDSLSTPQRLLPKRIRLPAPVSQNESEIILELLQQLVARLVIWRRALPLETAPRRAFPGAANALGNRRSAIRKFIHDRHAGPIRLEDLAEFMHLSPSRTAHAVKEACGTSFVQLLTEERLRTAASLLQHSGLPLLEILLRSGLGDPSHFHRLFRQRFGTTPHAYRRHAETPSV